MEKISQFKLIVYAGCYIQEKIEDWTELLEIHKNASEEQLSKIKTVINEYISDRIALEELKKSLYGKKD